MSAARRLLIGLALLAVGLGVGRLLRPQVGAAQAAPEVAMAPRAAGEWQGMRVPLADAPICETSAGCGMARACIQGRCQACRADAQCAGGERCVLEHCVRTELAACASAAECDGEALCVLSGISADPRGNAAMRATCLSPRGGTTPAHVEPVPGDPDDPEPDVNPADLLERARQL